MQYPLSAPQRKAPPVPWTDWRKPYNVRSSRRKSTRAIDWLIANHSGEWWIESWHKIDTKLCMIGSGFYEPVYHLGYEAKLFQAKMLTELFVIRPYYFPLTNDLRSNVRHESIFFQTKGELLRTTMPSKRLLPLHYKEKQGHWPSGTLDRDWCVSLFFWQIFHRPCLSLKRALNSASITRRPTISPIPRYWVGWPDGIQ